MSFAYVLLMLLALWAFQLVFGTGGGQAIPYSEFKQRLAAGELSELVLEMPDTIYGKIVAKPKDGEGQAPPRPFHTVAPDDKELIEKLDAAGVQYTVKRPSFWSTLLVGWLLPLGLLATVWFLLARRASAGPSLLSFGKSRARLVADDETGVRFADVAGCDEAKAELMEVVDFLRNPDRYRALGAKIPKGVLLVGPPGTGKTLIARAVAGEASVPFFSLSGSDFVEMFVGVGAARVRDLFVQASQKAPCIIFIDELDAIGRQRGVHVVGGNDEREQTLNQLLVEMDGFDTNKGVILLAATNRPDVLDRALLRPGRFDRQVILDAPDLDGREQILKVHARNKPLAKGVDLRRIAQRTPGFAGADLANALNEAALLAARRTGKEIEQQDLEEAVEKVVAGPERKSRRLSDEDKRRVAFHEVGHALVAHFTPHGKKVSKISIVPRGKAALGYTMQLPEENQYLMTRAELVDEIKGLLGGRAAEEVVLGDLSTGAGNDLERATSLARSMVATYGMSEVVGLAHCVRQAGVEFLNPDLAQLDCSEETARKIDLEVKRILDDCYRDARRLLIEHREQLERVARELLQRESLDGTAFEQLLDGGTTARPESL
jgi:cell division protease FtsH